ncbi:MAG: DeoR family transcriptional regulator [Thermoplasmata archaeon]|nr:DeoR family transcriptional regulator [Thermoplasmata archaeon]
MSPGALAGSEEFSSPKRAILLLLKRRGSLSLEEVAAELRISRVAALRHLSELESHSLLERTIEKGRVGRPRHRFALRAEARRLFPQAYSELSVSALEFVERRLGRSAVAELLEERNAEAQARHRPRLGQAELPDRVRALARLRDDEGYMAEYGGRRRGTCELTEHNCPIFAIAESYPEACETERRMFESLLDARVTTTHRVVEGDGVCRFLVRPKEARR